MIVTQYVEGLGWVGTHTESPKMCVSADTEEIARSQIEKALRWYHERRVKQVELEVLEALSEVVRLDPPDAPTPWKGPGPIEDTAPSEMSGVYDHTQYPMNGDYGC